MILTIKKKKGLKVLLMFLSLLLILFLFVHRTLTPIFFNLAEAEAVRLANKTISEAVSEGAKEIKYDDMIKYVINDKGYIVMMQPNIHYINNFISTLSADIQNKLEEISNMNVPIPIASIFGIELLAGFGPYANARIIPVGFVNPPRIIDSFLAAGINQTRHKIYLKVEVNMKLIVPFNTKTIEVLADVPIFEVTIMGEVPQVYIDLGNNEIPGIISQGTK